MYMRSPSSSRSKFYGHVRFSRPLTYTIASSSNRLAVWDHPVLSSQSIMIAFNQVMQDLSNLVKNFHGMGLVKMKCVKMVPYFNTATSLMINFLLTTNTADPQTLV